MKIGIITQPLHNNYGGLLQNYALQQTLIRMGHDPITLRAGTAQLSYSALNYAAHFCLWLAQYHLKRILGYKVEKPISQRNYKYDSAGMAGFIQKHIKCTPPLIKHYTKEITDLKLEALVVGSDQVWRPGYNADMMGFQFLGFSKGLDIIRLSYAASFGTDKWEFTDDETTQAADLLRKFDAVSVREMDAVRMCKEHLGVEATWVVDPTMLLNWHDYLQLCKDVTPKKDKYVFAYILDDEDGKRTKVKTAASSLGFDVVFVDDKHTKHDDTVEQWLAHFRDASYIVTDSFHGTVFALLFHKQFLCLYNEKRGSSRMESLKAISGLENRFATKMSQLPIEKIDYGLVLDKIERKREKSLEFLIQSLNKHK